MGQVIFFIVLAALLASVELIVPGGIFGVVAVILIGVASWLAYEPYGMTGSLLTFVLGTVFVFTSLFFAFKIIGQSRLKRNFVLDSRVTGQSGSIGADDSLLGQVGRALTTMAPTGRIEIENRSFEAAAQSGMINRGSRVKVVARDNYRLIVEKI